MMNRLMIACVSGAASIVHAAPLAPGEPAPPITLEAVSNTGDATIPSWESYGEGVVVLEFWGTWCGPCVGAIPHLNEVANAVAANDEITFLSVTYEPVAEVAPFLERLPMEAVVGHDTDRSMVNAYGVLSWPTTFVLRDGVVLLRTHPERINADLLLALADERRAPAALARFYAGGHESRVGRSASAARAAKPERASIAQVLVGPAEAGDDRSLSVSTMPDGREIAASGYTAAELIGLLWEAGPGQLDLEPAVADDPRVYTLTVKSRDAHMDIARRYAAAALGLRIEEETRTVDGFRVSAAPGGSRLVDPHGSGGYVRSKNDGAFITIESPRMRLGALFEKLDDALGGPVDLPPAAASGEHSVDIRVPADDPDRARAVIREELGLLVEPAGVERAVVVVRRAETDG